MNNFWDLRYKEEGYAYGTKPNEFFKNIINTFKEKGTLLLPAEGEGRNAVYASKTGWNVYAFDTSIEGKMKADKLAKSENVVINYEVGAFFDLELINLKFDVAALIFAHFTTDMISDYHKKVADLLKPNGVIILEGFSKNHVEFQKENPNAGGPKNVDMLFSVESIKKDFSNFEIIKLEEIELELEEGKYHQGKAKVIRFVGRKYNCNKI
jgi:cyclopropane fatty-acyl-phospholipid synthase-like methyltransferase